MTQYKDKLLGVWLPDPGDGQIPREFENTSLEFKNGAQLDYVIHGTERVQKVFLEYRIEGDCLVTDQPSRRREEHTRFAFTPDDKLILEFEGRRIVYVRAAKGGAGYCVRSQRVSGRNH